MLNRDKSSERSKSQSPKVTQPARSTLWLAAWEALENRVLMSTSVWTGAGSDINFSNPGNWQNNAVPTTGDDAVFPAGASVKTVTVDTNVSLGSISINEAGYAIAGSNITVAGGITAVGSSEIDSDLTLASSQTVSVTGGTLTLAGNVDDAGNAFGLTETGNGTINLSGSGTYAGATNVNGGALDVEGTLSSQVNVAQGASLDGNGLVGGIASTGGTVSPGVSSSAGLLTDSGGLTLDSGSTYAVELDGNTPGTGPNFYGQVSAGGNVNLGSATLSVTLGSDYAPAAGDSLTLISTSGGSTTGTFAGLPEGATLTLGGDKVFRISYVGGSGHDTTLSFVRASTLTLSSSASPSVVGQAVTFTATVAPTDAGSGTATGTVTFYDNGVAIGSSHALNGSAQATVVDSLQTVGTHSITASYSGDTGFQAATTSAALSQVVNAASTTTTVSSSTSGSSVWGQSVTFTAAVAATAPGSGSPAGTVQFFADGVAIGSPQTVTSGSAGFTTTGLSVGARAITASFTSGNSSYNNSASSTLTQTVAKSSTTTSVSSSSLSSVVGQAVTFTATVAASGNGAGVRTGTVTFKDGSTTIGTGTVNASGVATFTTSAVALGSHTITAVYGGDAHFLTSTSSSISQSVAQASTRVLVSTSATPAVYGQAITLSASVAAISPGSGTATGSASFSVDGTPIGSVTLASGHASISAGVLSVGTHSIVVSYGGDSNYSASTSSTVTQRVNKSSISVNVSSSVAPAVFGQVVTYSVTAAAAGNGSGTPDSGLVTLTDENGATLATGTLVSGAASINVSTLAVGSHTVTASYAGDGNFLIGTGNVGQVINKASTTTSVVSSGTPSVAGQPVTFTATVSVDAPGNAGVSGTVAFFDGDTNHQIGATQTLSGSTAAVTTSTLTTGSHNIFSVYTPDNGNVTGSTSAVIVQSDNQAATTTGVTTSNSSSASGESITLTATVAPTAPGAGTPGGTVTFYDNGSQLGAPITLSGGVGHLDISALSVGAHPITAVYSGDTDYSTSDSTSSVLTQTVNQANTTTVITADHNPSKFDQSVTFTATIGISGSGSGARTGTVTFSVDGISQAPVNVSGNTATLSISSLSVAGHTVDAVYSGDADFTGSTAVQFNQTNQASDTTTSVSSSNAAAVFGEQVTLTATVAAAAPGAGTPNSGTVTFYADGNTGSPLGTGAVTAGVATLAGVTLPVGTHGITAVYGGNGDYQASSASSVDQEFAKASTSLALSTPTTVVFGEQAALTATVSVLGNGAGTPTGNVVFYADGDLLNPIGTQSLSGGVATLNVSSLGVGAHAITATYVGDGNFVTANAASVNQVVNKSNSTLTVSSSSNFSSGAYHSVYGETVSFTATAAASGAGAGTPTGAVTFSDGSLILGTAQLSNGVATLSTSTLNAFMALGSHSVTASYAADANFNASDSTAAPITQSVAQASTTSTVTSLSGTTAFAQTVTFTATVGAQVPANGTPTGTVTFFDGVTQLGTPQTLTNGTATLDVPDLTVTTHAITVQYSGDTNYDVSTSAPLSQIVNPPSTTVLLTSSDTSPVAGESLTLTANVSATAGSGVPTGNVTFFDNGVAIGAAHTLVNGEVAITTTLAVGTHNLTASYANIDGNFSDSTTASALLNPVAKDSVTVGVTSSVNSSVFGQSTGFTATVAAAGPGSGTPTGTVTFYSDGSQIGAPVALSSGSATLPFATLSADTHDISAVYNGDANFLAGTTAASALSQTVDKADTTLAMGATTTSIYGANATFTATVSAAAPGAGTPTGTVYFYADGSNTALGHATVNGSGVATLATAALPEGDHVITASYAGDSNFNTGVSSGSVTQHVNQSPTTTSLAVSSGSDVWGQNVTFTATLAASGGGGGIPQGEVIFVDHGVTTLGAAVLTNGQAIFQTSSLDIGSHSIRAVYVSDDDINYLASSSPVTAVTITKAATTLGVTSSVNPSVFNQSTTLTATVAVTSPGAGTPTGTITFLDNGVSIGSGTPDSNGVVTLATSTLAVAGHPITATYSGDADFLASTSSVLTQTVNKASAGITVASTAATTAVFGQAVTLTASVTGTGTPTGTVTFFDGGVAIGNAAALSSGSASVVTSALTTGSHTITASYNGDGNFNSQTSANLTQVVNQASTTTAVISDHSQAVAGQSVTFTATVTATGPGVGTPTGSVIFYADGTPIGSAVNLSGNTASITTSALSTTGHAITAVYSGDTNFLTSTSPSLTQSQQQDSSSVVLGTASASSTYGQNPVLTATVSADLPGGGTPTGSITFYDGTGINAVSLGQGTLTNGIATLSSYTLGAGSHSLTAVYSGDTNFASSTSAPVSQSVASAGTSIAITGDTAGEFGQQLTVTAAVTLTSGSGNPTGNIAFYDAGTLLNTVPVVSGSAALTTSYSVGSHPITATYLPTGGNFSGSTTSASYAVGVSAASTTTTLAATTPTVAGQSASFTATVAISGNGVGTPNGHVSFYDNGTLLGAVNVVSGQAAYSTGALTVGSHAITAVYGNDTRFATSTATAVTQQVAQATTSASVSSTTASSALGQSLTLTATVSPVSPGAGVPTGVVTFKDGSSVLGTGLLDNSGHSTFATSALALGSHSITATYAGDANFTGITTGAYVQTIVQASTTTTITSVVQPAVSGQSVTFSAIAAGSGAGLLTGTITFYDGGTQLGSGTFDGTNAVTQSVSNLTVGSHSITAVFSGNTNYAGSTSSAASQLVSKAASAVSLTASSGPLLPGAPVTLTATVSAIAPGVGVATGTVNFFDGSTSLGSATVTNGVATRVVTTLVSGNHSITASYVGDSRFNTAASNSTSVHINLPGTLQFGSPTLTVNKTGGAATITVTRTGGAEGAVSASYAVTGGTAVNGTDYTLTAGTVSFANGQTSATISVPITNDGKFGNDKTVLIAISSPGGGATLGTTSTSTLTIHEDNAKPSLSVSSPSVVEAVNGSAVATFTVALSNAADVDVQVSYTTADGTTTAASGSYLATSGQLTFPAGTTVKTVTVNVNGTSTPGTNQTFALDLSAPSNATIASSRGIATIVNNNFPNPTVTDVSGTAAPGLAITLSPLASAHSNDGGPLTLSIATAPTSGTASVTTVNGTQVLSYVPGAGAIPSDSFTYRVTDSHGDSATGTATVSYVGTGVVVSSLQPGLTDLVILGTAGNDSIKITQSTAKKFKVVVNGVTAGVFAPTGRIVAFGGAGNDLITTSGVTKAVWFYGGAGNDTLQGGSAADVLVGGDGADSLAGGAGRNILVGGNGTDVLKSTGTDILIAGATAYDDGSVANQAAMNTALNEWVNHKAATLHSVGAPNGVRLDATTIADDGSSDVLIGKKTSWFFGNFQYSGGNDTFSDGRKVKNGQVVKPTSGELVTNVAPQ